MQYLLLDILIFGACIFHEDVQHSSITIIESFLFFASYLNVNVVISMSLFIFYCTCYDKLSLKKLIDKFAHFNINKLRDGKFLFIYYYEYLDDNQKLLKQRILRAFKLL